MEEKKTFSNHIAKKQPKYSIKPVLSYYPKPEAHASGFAFDLLTHPNALLIAAPVSDDIATIEDYPFIAIICS